MIEHKLSRQFRVGLQSKSVIILTLVVLSAMLCGGWFYYEAARNWFRAEDHRRAMRIAQALSLAAQYDLQACRYEVVQRLVNEYLRNDDIMYVSIVDATGRIVASASRNDRHGDFAGLGKLPVSVSVTRRNADDSVMLASPIILRDTTWWKDRLAGGVRLVTDTSATTAQLRLVRRRMSVVAAVIIICAIPMGYLLVWRVILQPVGKLLEATRRLGEGDFNARASLRCNDEIGELAGAFNSMAADVAHMRDELVDANESLEQKVSDRTNDLEVANGRLREEMAEKEDFLRAVSHDLNAPLRNIAGMATMVMMKWRNDLPEDVVARLQRIQANVDVETELIGELLELSRIRSRPQRREIVDMRKLLNGVAATFEFELKNRAIELTIAEAMPSICVERNRLRQVFQNLVDNAIKYIDRPGGGRIELGYELSDGCHVFSVTDNGPGVPADQREKIFYVFRRASSAANSHIAGKGVGLALVKSVVANYDGRAWVESPRQQGARFCVALPVADTRPPERGEFRGQEETSDAATTYNSDSR